ncbi:MAG: hypothetical protein HRU75_02620 [Planctomycetia bacterium]|nr:MAG: hypothetical protein HRU75_02620 [Planctomycetia bacterium]
MLRRSFSTGLCILLAAGLSLGGCPEEFRIDIDVDDDDDGGFVLNLAGLAAAIGLIQIEDPREVVLPPAIVNQGDTIIINNNVTVIVNAQQDIIVEDVPDRLIVGFENLTEFDVYLKYFADGELQGIFIFSGETLLLEYPCLDEIELLSEDDIDPFTGEFVQGFDLFSVYERTIDFDCGEAFIITIDELDIIAATQSIELLIRP